MAAGQTLASRRSWMNAEARAELIRIPEAPTLGQIFTRGFLRGSMLQMAVCTPPRQAMTRKYEAVFVTSLGAKANAEAASQPIEA